MSIYIVGFLLSIVLFYYAETKRFTGLSAKIVTGFALLIPCLIAGFRDVTIGTDVQGYVNKLFLTAEVSDSLLEYYKSGYSLFGWDYSAVMECEIGFSLLTFLVQRFFGHLNALLFVIQAMTVVPIYKGLRAMLNSKLIWLGMAVYYLMFFNQSLNLMRQWMAMAILFYAFQFLPAKRYYKYFLFVAVAMLFHFSAIIGCIIFVVYLMAAKENSYHIVLKVTLLVVIGLMSLLSLEYLTQLLRILGLRYGNYIDGNLQLMPNQFLYRLPIFLLLLVRWRHLQKKDHHTAFYLVMIVYDVLASQLTSIFAHSGRIGAYFSEYYMLVYPALSLSSKYKDNRKIISVAVVGYLCIYWWYCYAHLGVDETIPYLSIFS